jgi:hypothetical protein
MVDILRREKHAAMKALLFNDFITTSFRIDLNPDEDWLLQSYSALAIRESHDVN